MSSAQLQLSSAQLNSASPQLTSALSQLIAVDPESAQHSSAQLSSLATQLSSAAPGPRGPAAAGSAQLGSTQIRGRSFTLILRVCNFNIVVMLVADILVKAARFVYLLCKSLITTSEVPESSDIYVFRTKTWLLHSSTLNKDRN